LNENESYHNRTCRYDYTAVFDGFWLFQVDLSAAATTTDTNSNSSVVRNMTKHFEIDHALPELLRQECSSPGDTELSTRSLAFDGDVMTFKRSAILTYDVLTKSEAAPAVILGNADCQ
jgi:hypothetical protein